MARIMSLNYSRQGKYRRLWRDVIASYNYPFLLCDLNYGRRGKPRRKVCKMGKKNYGKSDAIKR